MIRRSVERSRNYDPLKEQTLSLTNLSRFQMKPINLKVIYQQKIQSLEELKKSILQKAFNGELDRDLQDSKMDQDLAVQR